MKKQSRDFRVNRRRFIREDKQPKEVVFFTTDLSQFIIDENIRPPYEERIKYFEQLFKVEGFNKKHPIIVNRNFYLYDGLLRLKAAERLGIGVYYQFDDTVEVPESGPMLYSQPIEYNDKLEITQGNHRFKAAMEILNSHPDFDPAKVLAKLGKKKNK